MKTSQCMARTRRVFRCIQYNSKLRIMRLLISLLVMFQDRGGHPDQDVRLEKRNGRNEGLHTLLIKSKNPCTFKSSASNIIATLGIRTFH